MDLDQRKHARFLCMEGGVLKLSVRPEFRGRRAYLIDLSSTGIGFIVEEALVADSVIVFELQSPEGHGVNRTARVRHARPHPAPDDAPWVPKPAVLSQLYRTLFGSSTSAPPMAWLVGCEFDHPISVQEIRQFLQSLNAPYEEIE
jgi:hypothetical protein